MKFNKHLKPVHRWFDALKFRLEEIKEIRAELRGEKEAIDYLLEVMNECKECHGSGESNEVQCPICGGKGALF